MSTVPCLSTTWAAEKIRPFSETRMPVPLPLFTSMQTRAGSTRGSTCWSWCSIRWRSSTDCGVVERIPALSADCARACGASRAAPQRMAEKQPKTMRRVKLSEIAEKPPAPEEIEDDAFFTGEEQEKAEEPEKKGKIPPILKELWSIEDKKQIFKAFGKLLKRLLKGILPGNFFLKATIGTGDPPTTGYLLGLAGILVTKFGNDIQIKGDFTKATVEDIEIRVKGKIVLGRLLWAVLAFGLTKPVRRAIRKEIRYFRGKKADAKGETA